MDAWTEAALSTVATKTPWHKPCTQCRPAPGCGAGHGVGPSPCLSASLVSTNLVAVVPTRKCQCVSARLTVRCKTDREVLCACRTGRSSKQTDRHCYLERRLRLSRASAAQNRAVRIIREVAGTHRSSHRTIRPRAPLRSGAPRTTSRPPRPRSRAASVATMRRRQRHPPAAAPAPAPPAPRASRGPARPRR